MHLQAHELTPTLDRVLVEVQQVRRRTVAKRRVLFDHCFDGFHKPLLNESKLFFIIINLKIQLLSVH